MATLTKTIKLPISTSKETSGEGWFCGTHKQKPANQQNLDMDIERLSFDDGCC
jgi:hypothetical protein